MQVSIAHFYVTCDTTSDAHRDIAFPIFLSFLYKPADCVIYACSSLSSQKTCLCIRCPSSLSAEPAKNSFSMKVVDWG